MPFSHQVMAQQLLLSILATCQCKLMQAQLPNFRKPSWRFLQLDKLWVSFHIYYQKKLRGSIKKKSKTYTKLGITKNVYHIRPLEGTTNALMVVNYLAYITFETKKENDPGQVAIKQSIPFLTKNMAVQKHGEKVLQKREVKEFPQKI